MNNVLAILGAQWGDEGKGAVVTEYLKPGSICVRAQGGNNAGHTLYDSEGTKHVVNIAPSGIIFSDVTNVIANGCVVDLEVLDQNMQGAKGKLYLSDAAHLIFNYHRFLDGGQEKSKGKKKIGTTGKGIGPAYADKINRVGIRTGMLQYPELLEDMLKEAVVTKNIEFLYRDIQKHVYISDVLKKMRPLFEKYAPMVLDTTDFLHAALKNNRKIVLEGAQGSMLDIDHGDYPYVTSSNTTVGGLITGTGLPLRAIDRVIGVVKAYSSRVGAGPFPTEGEPGEMINTLQDKEQYYALCRLTDEQKRIVQAGDLDHADYDMLVSRYIREGAQEFGSTTGRPRRVGWLDIPALQRAAKVNGLNYLAITRLDNLDGIGMLKICVNYQEGKPVYETFPGWKNTKGIIAYEDLPQEAKMYLATINGMVGVPLCKIKNGPLQENNIKLADPWLR